MATASSCGTRPTGSSRSSWTDAAAESILFDAFPRYPVSSAQKYFLGLAMCGLVAVIGWFCRRRAAGLGNTLLGLACAGMATLLVLQVWNFAGSSGSQSINRHLATASYFMGYEVVGELRGLQGTIALILPPESRRNRVELDSIFNTFARVLSPLSAVQIREVTLQATPQQIERGQIPLDRFEAAVTEARGALAYVSFVGVPAQVDRLKLWGEPQPPPLFVFDPAGTTNWLACLSQGRIRRVIIPRPDSNPTRSVTGAPDELFGRFFLMLQPENAEALLRSEAGAAGL